MIQSGLKLKGRRGLYFCTYLADVGQANSDQKKRKIGNISQYIEPGLRF